MREFSLARARVEAGVRAPVLRPGSQRGHVVLRRRVDAVVAGLGEGAELGPEVHRRVREVRRSLRPVVAVEIADRRDDVDAVFEARVPRYGLERLQESPGFRERRVAEAVDEEERFISGDADVVFVTEETHEVPRVIVPVRFITVVLGQQNRVVPRRIRRAAGPAFRPGLVRPRQREGDVGLAVAERREFGDRLHDAVISRRARPREPVVVKDEPVDAVVFCQTRLAPSRLDRS
mmetsp:Transcript_34689/g.107285  ORF Transcript_34689/g.107285 Transcript_34689/m.107285 type:complete len:234 (+) Transcript_34689:273-974(+)